MKIPRLTTRHEPNHESERTRGACADSPLTRAGNARIPSRSGLAAGVLAHAVLSLSLLGGGCATDVADPGSETEVAHSVQPVPVQSVLVPPVLPACTPQPPIDPRRCDPEEPAPPPPPINGKCTIDLRIDEVGFSSGQGWFENRAEASAKFTATNLATGGITTGSYPGSGTIKMEVGATHTVSVPLGTYEVLENDTLDVKVCAQFTEEDKGLNKDDVGIDCETVTLECPEPGENRGLRADLCKGGDCSKLRGAMTANLEVLTADADRDCVPNEDDYTPEPCDEALKGQLCRSSLVYFHYGDGILNDLVQNLGTNLVPAMTGYDRVVLLIDDDQIGPFNLNPAALGLADVVMLPTEQNFFASLQDLTSRGCDIDVWMFSHGTPEWEAQLDLSVIKIGGSVTAQADDDISLSPDITTVELLEDTDPAASGTPAVPVRMTYGTPCFYELWNAPWTTVGAKVTSGAIDINFRPNFYDNFVANWNGGMTYANSLANEYSAGRENLAFGFIMAEGLLPPWSCIGNTVLGTNPCAQNFFTDIDLFPQVDATGAWVDGPDEAKYGIGGPLDDTAGILYDPALSGATNMRRSSSKVMVGNGGISKSVPATLTWP